MTGKTGIRGVFETAATGCSVRAQVWKKNKGFKMIFFDPSNIDHLTDNEDGTSEVVLKSGLEIPVNMPFADLEKKIFHPTFREGGFIDLTSVTGVVFGANSAERLQKNRPFTEITMYIRKSGAQEYVIDVTRKEEWLDLKNIREVMDMNGRAIIIPLAEGIKSSFKESHMLVDISYAEFMRLYHEAKAQGSEKFDISEATGRFIVSVPPADKVEAPNP